MGKGFEGFLLEEFPVRLSHQEYEEYLTVDEKVETEGTLTVTEL